MDVSGNIVYSSRGTTGSITRFNPADLSFKRWDIGAIPGNGGVDVTNDDIAIINARTDGIMRVELK